MTKLQKVASIYPLQEPLKVDLTSTRISPIEWPEDMAWISEMRAIDDAKSAMLDRIEAAKGNHRESVKLSRYCEEVSQAFAFLSMKALK